MEVVTVDPLPAYPDILLAIHNLPGPVDTPRFHWQLFVQSPDPSAFEGSRLHAVRDRNTNIWRYERTDYTLIHSKSIASAVIIGKLENHTIDELDAIVSAIPMAIPTIDEEREPRWSCRVWTREALRRLHKAGYIECPDVDALEEEVLTYGRVAAKAIDDKTFKVAALVKAKNAK